MDGSHMLCRKLFPLGQKIVTGAFSVGGSFISFFRLTRALSETPSENMMQAAEFSPSLGSSLSEATAALSAPAWAPSPMSPPLVTAPSGFPGSDVWTGRIVTLFALKTFSFSSRHTCKKMHCFWDVQTYRKIDYNKPLGILFLTRHVFFPRVVCGLYSPLWVGGVLLSYLFYALGLGTIACFLATLPTGATAPGQAPTEDPPCLLPFAQCTFPGGWWNRDLFKCLL